ncbi:MAG: hypothetical protein ACRC92_20740 [Peptostreptococcaceae bacterium]
MSQEGNTTTTEGIISLITSIVVSSIAAYFKFKKSNKDTQNPDVRLVDKNECETKIELLKKEIRLEIKDQLLDFKRELQLFITEEINRNNLISKNASLKSEDIQVLLEKRINYEVNNIINGIRTNTAEKVEDEEPK